MNYEQAMEYIYSTSWMGSILGLTRMRELMQRLGNPQDQIPTIHIAGTNGKGSTAAMLAEILTQAGYRTGLYTSPAIHYFGERMMIGGEPIAEEDIARLTERMKEAAEGMEQKPTEYELITALSFLYFAENCEIGIIETGMGGLLDATNVISKPVLSIITPIGKDHIKELGDTIEAIAEQKAGIIKEGAPVVLAEQDEAVTDVIRRIAREKSADLSIAKRDSLTPLTHALTGQDFLYAGERYTLALLGQYQLQNAATTLCAVEQLRHLGWSISTESLKRGLSAVRWPGRFEVLHTAPTVILDGAHNPQGAASLLENLQTYFPGQCITMIVGILADKEYNKVVECFASLPSRWIAVTPHSDRALPANELARSLREYHAEVDVIESVSQALSQTMERVKPDEVICVFGTLTLIDEVRKFFNCQ